MGRLCLESANAQLNVVGPGVGQRMCTPWPSDLELTIARVLHHPIPPNRLPNCATSPQRDRHLTDGAPAGSLLRIGGSREPMR